MLIGDHWAVELNGFTKSYPTGWLGRSVRAVGPISMKLAPGQVLILEGVLFGFQMIDGSGANLQTNRTVAAGDLLILVWNGTSWLEMGFANN